MTLNEALDGLPRTRFGRATREVPAFRTCGVTGFYLAIVVTFGAGLLAGVSPVVVATVCLTSGLSFFLWALLRRLVTGTEKLVLLEHVWFAEACVAAVVWAEGEPVLPALDALAVGLCVFLAAGRVGCLLVGCCHGRPSAIGIRYGREAVRDGFPRELEGVRLFPVPALEAAGLLAIGAAGLVALPWAAAGTVFVWFLVAYSVLRFALEGLRGDERPEWLGLSVNRWMCVTEFTVALVVAAHEDGGVGAGDLVLLGVLALALAVTLAALRAFDVRRRLLAPAHEEELRGAVRTLLEHAHTTDIPDAVTTSRGITVAASRVVADGRASHVSLSRAGARADVELLCELAARVLPGVQPASARVTDGGVVHVLADPAAPNGVVRGRVLQAAVARALEPEREAAEKADALRRTYFAARRAG
jgi:prolipoprotein diacylglyceryl transferase